MPVRHLFMSTEPNLDDEEREFYGPIDGVLPRDYPEAYERLLELFCLTAVNHRAVFIAGDQRLCGTCYHGATTAERNQYRIGGWHTISIYSTAIRNSRCHKCLAQLCRLRQADRCTECIEQYFEMTPQQWRRIQSRHTVDVITRW